jgi:ABC-2 type transport system ATP-binding protein
MSSPTAEELSAATPAGLEPVIRLDDVSVRYRLPRERITSVKDYTIRLLKRQIAYDEFWALHNVTLDVRRGETLGVIGRNGAGKSTLLKVVARVLRPTSGRVSVRGRVAPLLELGAGFDYELTGRDNVFLNGTILGFSEADIEQRFDRIVDFAGVREVLLLDEVLSVGDAEFQAKSAARMQELRRHGDAIVMVSHSLDSVRQLCHRVAWLDQGRLRSLGTPDEVIAEYRKASLG